MPVYPWSYDNLWNEDWLLDDPAPARKPVEPETIYVYLKGSGWVPETPNVQALLQKQKRERDAAKSTNFGMPYGFDIVEDMDFMQQRIERLREQLDRDLTRQWFIDPEPNDQLRWYGQYTQTAAPRVPEAQREYFTVEGRGPRQIPRRADERYYQGADVRVEREDNEESIHARRLREYEDARRRWRGR